MQLANQASKIRSAQVDALVEHHEVRGGGSRCNRKSQSEMLFEIARLRTVERQKRVHAAQASTLRADDPHGRAWYKAHRPGYLDVNGSDAAVAAAVPLPLAAPAPTAEVTVLIPISERTLKVSTRARVRTPAMPSGASTVSAPAPSTPPRGACTRAHSWSSWRARSIDRSIDRSILSRPSPAPRREPKITYGTRPRAYRDFPFTGSGGVACAPSRSNWSHRTSHRTSILPRPP